MIKVDEIAHLLGQFAPFGREFHHVLATFLVIVGHGYIFGRLLVVDVGLCDAEFFLHAQFYGQTVCVPSCFALDLKAFHRFISIKGVFDAACQYVMDTGMTVGRGRSFVENELWTAFALVDGLVEDVVFLPFGQHFFVGLWEVECFMLGKFLSHVFIPFLFFRWQR